MAQAETTNRNLLEESLKHARSLERRYYQLLNGPSLDLELGAEFDRMLDLSKIIDVKVSATAMIAFTDIIYCVDSRSNKTHEIGAFEITIPFKLENEIVWINTTQKIDASSENYNAPHINAVGHACLGNTKDRFAKLRADRDLATLLLFAIAFLESVNAGDAWGKYIDRWPIANGINYTDTRRKP